MANFVAVAALLGAVCGIVRPTAGPSQYCVGQGGKPSCAMPVLGWANAELDSMLWLLPNRPTELHWLLYDATRVQAEPEPVPQILRDATRRHGASAVAVALLGIVFRGYPGEPVADADRAQAAVAYGVLHALYPDSVPVSILIGLLARNEFSDELRGGLVLGAHYAGAESPALLATLRAVLCQAAYHVRPFVEDSSDLELFGSRSRLSWYLDAVILLQVSVNTLALKQGGAEVIGEFVAVEANPVIRNQVAKWAENPSSAPYWPG